MEYSWVDCSVAGVGVTGRLAVGEDTPAHLGTVGHIITAHAQQMVQPMCLLVVQLRLTLLPTFRLAATHRRWGTLWLHQVQSLNCQQAAHNAQNWNFSEHFGLEKFRDWFSKQWKLFLFATSFSFNLKAKFEVFSMKSLTCFLKFLLFFNWSFRYAWPFWPKKCMLIIFKRTRVF